MGLLAALTSLQGKLEKSLDHLQKQMEDALLFQAQAEETCALWQAGGWALRSQGWGGGALVPSLLDAAVTLMLLITQHSCSRPSAPG